MNKNLQSPTKLTEFAPLQLEEKPQGVGQLLSRFFKLSKSNADENAATNPNPDTVSQESLPSWAIDSSPDVPVYPRDTVYAVDVNEGRSLPNVLKRISNLLALKSNNLQDYADTDLKQYWMPDSVSKECYECSEKFTTFRRRHHCRVCGQIFCSQCCNQQIPGKIFGCTGDLRVCTYCCKVVLSYLSSDLGNDLTADLKLLQENLQSKFGNSPLSPSTSLQDSVTQHMVVDSESNSLRRKISVGYQEETFASGGSSNISYLTSEEKCRALQNSASLRNLFEEMCKVTTGITLGTHRYRLRTYTNCFLGSELVDWLICQQKANTRIQAAAICQALLEGGYIECVSEPSSFVDGFALYKTGEVMSPEEPTVIRLFDIPTQDEPIWVQQIPQESTTDSENEQVSPVTQTRPFLKSSSSYMLDLNVGANTVYLSRPPLSDYNLQPAEMEYHEHKEKAEVRTSEHREYGREAGWHNALNLREENGEKLAYTLLNQTFEQHEQSLLKQLLSSHGLSLSWCDIILPLIHEIVNVIRPDKNHDAEDLDVRHYIQYKKLSGGRRENTKLINGVVCSKNVAHKGMSTDIENPKILLLQCSIVYQRTEGRLMSLEPVLMQEHEYLRHVAARIIALKPDIVLVHRNVSRLAQDFLRENGITLVLNVKENILDRLSRCLQADLVTAVDAHIGRPRLGTCKRFYLKSFNIEKGGVKTLMFFEGVPLPHLGATVILRGGTKFELAQLKKVSDFFLFAVYNWRLEKSFLMDEYAQPPNSICEFLDDSKENSPTFASESEHKPLNEPKKRTHPLKSVTEDDGSIQRNGNEKENAKKTVTEQINDYTDPLHNYRLDEDKLDKNVILSVAELPFSNNFRKSLDDTILCISPYLMFSVPYLETDLGKKCSLRKFFPPDIFYSKQFGPTSTRIKAAKDLENEIRRKSACHFPKQLHPFITSTITNVENIETQRLLAHFRACGGTYAKKDFVYVKSPVEEEVQKKLKKETDKLDALDPSNHQRLAVLFCSFNNESHHSPFCVNPWVVYMDFYGRNDIPLGCFLEKYCFRASYTCPSKICDMPMAKHIRRFVHNSGCVSISLNHFDNEFPEENIVMWTWCTKCHSVSPVVPMSADTWSFSFAKFLELKFYGGMYSRRGNSPCCHSLHHDHYQYFGYKDAVATFKYTSVDIWEISLPPSKIEIKYDNDNFHIELMDEIKAIAQKGHDIFNLISEKISCLSCEAEAMSNFKQMLSKEQSMFKQKIEDIQLQLTSPTVESKDFDDQAVYFACWKIHDSINRIRKLIVELVDSWNMKLTEATKRRDSDKKKEKFLASDQENTTAEIKGPQETDQTSNKIVENPIQDKKTKNLEDDINDEYIPGSPKTSSRIQPDGISTCSSEDIVDNKKESDKKTVKTLLSQLLPSSSPITLIPNPFDSQGHYTLPQGLRGSLAVFESDLSSIIAYALDSTDYRKALEEAKKFANADQTSSPLTKRKQSEKEKSDSSDDKNSGLLGFLRNKDSKNENLTTADADASISTSTSPEIIDDLKKGKKLHIDVVFEDSSCNFLCRIYFAEKFAALRSLVLPSNEEDIDHIFIRSLSRSVHWNARGGKSGSNFTKTSDDRFVLKETSKSEVQLFLESASNYFNYMQKCHSSGQPTLLGKIVGIYQIIFKNNSNGQQLRKHLLVMENLFYNRTVSQKFDLKGSVRNRLVIPDNQEGEIVLLDENLLKMSCDSPLYILPHSKAVLTAAIQNDTEFLSSQSVMDYSLLVGLDPVNKELVLGIIDYIRTFTWDKRLETMVKKSGILGGQGKQPTIISPKDYQTRFIEAMHKYFLEVPDHWAGLGKGLEF